MNLDKIAPGALPDNLNVVIEIPQGSGAIKYELDKESGALLVDRFLGTAMNYPANYGFVPGTLADDGDPLDVLVVSPAPIIPGAVIAVRPIGVLKMEDEKGMDEKILALPRGKLTPFYDKIDTYTDLPEILLKQICHFFERYKDLEEGKWVKIQGWAGKDVAAELIEKAIKAAS